MQAHCNYRFLYQKDLPAMSEFTGCLWLSAAVLVPDRYNHIFSISRRRKINSHVT